MSESLSYGKQIIARWIKERQLDNRVKDILLEMLKEAKIPDEWDHNL